MKIGPKQIPFPAKLVLLFVGVLGLGIFSYTLGSGIIDTISKGLLPAERSITVLESEIKKLEQIPLYESLAQNLEQGNRKHREIKTELENLQSYFKESSELSSIIKDLTNFIPLFEMEIVDIKPLKVVSNTDYLQLPVDITLRCTFKDLALYLKMLEELPRLIFTESIKIGLKRGGRIEVKKNKNNKKDIKKDERQDEVTYCEATIRVITYYSL